MLFLFLFDDKLHLSGEVQIESFKYLHSFGH